MRRYARKKREPVVPKVESVDVTVKHPKRRAALIITLLVIGLGFIGYGTYNALTKDPGWQEVTVSSDAAINCGSDLHLSYEFEKGTATVENKQLTALYTQACEHAYAMFQPRQAMIGVKNLYAVNASPNVPVQVEPELYVAFSILAQAGSRALYLAPIYAEYDQIFYSSSPYEAEIFDPFTSAEEQAYFAEVLSYVRDPAHVELELLGDYTVCLHVSDEYLRFAEEYGIDAFLDFYWMKNAFIVDYIATVLHENGFTRVVLSSVDGYSRYLDERDEVFTYSLLDFADGQLRTAAKLDFRGPCALVAMQAFPVGESFTDRYCTMPSGEIRTAYIDPEDGLCRCAVPTLVGRYVASTVGCAEILLQLAPLYIADSFDAQAAQALMRRADDISDRGAYTVYCTGDTIVCNDPQATLREVYHGYTVE